MVAATRCHNPAVADNELAFLAGRSVEQIWVWGPVRLVIELGGRRAPDVYIDFDDAVFTTRGGDEIAVDAFERPAEAGIVLTLLNDRIDDARYNDGTLYLSFGSGAKLRALPSAKYESWCVAGDGMTLRCLPGGEIGSW